MNKNRRVVITGSTDLEKMIQESNEENIKNGNKVVNFEMLENYYNEQNDKMNGNANEDPNHQEKNNPKNENEINKSSENLKNEENKENNGHQDGGLRGVRIIKVNEEEDYHDSNDNLNIENNNGSNGDFYPSQSESLSFEPKNEEDKETLKEMLKFEEEIKMEMEESGPLTDSKSITGVIRKKLCNVFFFFFNFL